MPRGKKKPQPLRILCAPGAFKECMSASEAAAAMARGVRRAAQALNREIEAQELPLSDGGADFLDTLHPTAPHHHVEVAGPLGNAVKAAILLVARIRAVIQLSSAAGLALVPKDQRDPTRTTTFGVGQLILAALDLGAREIIIGVGNSATVDGGAGALEALGVRFFDANDQPLPLTPPTRGRGAGHAPAMAGGDLARIARIDTTNLDPRLKKTKITVACDVDNPLAPGSADGAAQTFGPQKGATPEQVAELERGLANFVEALRAAGFDPEPDAPHSGAAGGFGFGLATVLGAELVPAVSLLLHEQPFSGCDLVLTGEGRIDGQTVRGKLPIAVAKEARKIGVPAIALVGSVGEGAEKTLDPEHATKPGGETRGGLLDYLVITPEGMPLEESLRRGPKLLEAAAERAVREWIHSPPAKREG